jgi:hypothetical protein
MPASLIAPHLASTTVLSEVCGECCGSLTTIDDGSVTGVVGAVIPCGCADYLYGYDGGCACRIAEWPFNDGHTGWVPLSREETRSLPEDAPLYRACREHNAAARRLAPAVAA